MSTVTSNINLSGKDFLSLNDFSKEEILYLLQEAADMKNNKIQHIFQGKTLAMIFEKSSTRTRVSFEAGMAQLGGNALFLSSKDMQLGRGRRSPTRRKCSRDMWTRS